MFNYHTIHDFSNKFKVIDIGKTVYIRYGIDIIPAKLVIAENGNISYTGYFSSEKDIAFLFDAPHLGKEERSRLMEILGSVPLIGIKKFDRFLRKSITGADTWDLFSYIRASYSIVAGYEAKTKFLNKERERVLSEVRRHKDQNPFFTK